MKRLKYLLAMLVAVTLVALPVLHASAETNLITNPSAESTDSTGKPTGWKTGRWGNNTATLTQKNEGHTGDKSLYVDVTSYVDGDAKWMADAVSVKPNTTYTYTSFYKSNVATEIDLQYEDAAGNVTYAYVQTVPASADWTGLSASFTTPANAAKVTVLHVINQVGWLQTDDISLLEKVSLPSPATGNLYANPSVETASGSAPANWSANRWGNNTATLSYANDGRTGNKSLKAVMTAHTDGDAKWMADAVSVTPNKSYTYSAYYKSNVETEVNLQYTDASGNVSYEYVQSVPASADWTQLSFSFTSPANASKVTVLHVLDRVGSLQTDDFSLTETITAPPVDDENLFANASMETENVGKPVNWNSNSWGTNTSQFTYETTGRTGNRSVKVTTSAYTSGDAKWYADPVEVVAGKPYLYRDYYKATGTTRIVAAFIDANGNYTYAEQSTAPAKADWTQYSTTFTVPANTVKATVYHVIDSAGTLALDDALLMVAVPTGGTEIAIPNSSFEQGTTMPTDWQSNSWGNNTASFQHVNEGRTGNKSAKVTVSNYVDGDAKWSFTPITTLVPGKQYRFTAWYKGTAAPHVVAMYQKADGSYSYVGLPSPQSVTTSWQKYSDTFTVPEGVVATSIFMYVGQNGWLQTDDYSLSTYHPNGFNRPLLTLTFDDGHEDNATTALPLLNQYGFKTTQCYATSFIEGQSQDIIQGVRNFYNTGHEICSHTVTHPFLTSLNATNLQYELTHSKNYLEQLLGIKVNNFASPYGDYNAAVNDVIDNLYRSHRTVDEGFNSKDNFDIYRLRVQNILDTTTAEQVQKWIEQAQADNTWLILVYHRVASNPGPYDTYTNIFEEQLKVIKDSNITVKTYNDALNEVLPQL